MSRKNNICGNLTEMGVKKGAYGHVSLLLLIVYTKMDMGL